MVINNKIKKKRSVTKDIYSDSYIVAIPYDSFSYQVWGSGIERDLRDLLHSTIFGHVSKTERLVNAIREGIQHFDG